MAKTDTVESKAKTPADLARELLAALPEPGAGCVKTEAETQAELLQEAIRQYLKTR